MKEYITQQDVDEARESIPVNFGPIGNEIYSRTYARTKQNGEKEDWYETCQRVVNGNLNFVDPVFVEQDEGKKLFNAMLNMEILPAGRHIYATNIGRDYINNCFGSAYTEDFTEHFYFTFMRLMEGGGVGANYSDLFINSREGNKSWSPKTQINLHILCHPGHQDYENQVDIEIGEDKLYGKNPKLKDFVSLKYCYEWDPKNSNGNAPLYIRVEDSREGWADTLVLLLNAHINTNNNVDLVVDISNIRPRGSTLKGFGGKASGPDALVLLLFRINKLLNSKVGQALTSLDFMAIDHYIACAVVSGGVRRCLPARSMVHLDRGLVPIKDVKVGDLVLTEKGKSKVSATFYQGTQEVIELKTYLGSFWCTPNHKMAVMSDINGGVKWVEAQNLTKNDRLVFCTTPIGGTKLDFPEFSYTKLPKDFCSKDITIPELDEGMAWLIGNLHGDGCIPQKNGKVKSVEFVTSSKESEIIEKIKAQLARFNVYISERKFDTYTRLAVKSRPLAEFLSQFKRSNCNIEIPSCIQNNLISIRQAYIAGLFDADGCEREKQIACTIYPKFGKDLQNLCFSLGLPVALRKWKYAKGIANILNISSEHFQMQFNNTVGKYSCKKLQLNSTSAAKSFCISKELALASAPSVDERRKAYHPTLSWPKIIEIFGEKEVTPIFFLGFGEKKIEETYDIEVENEHRFICEGLLTHNSARMSQKYWKDSDIFDFITCKRTKEGEIPGNWTTNISTIIDNKFFRALKKGDVHATKVFDSSVEGILNNGEPGFINASTSLIGEAPNAVYYCNNPCSEINLMSYPDMPCFDVCNLGHVNLDRCKTPEEAFRLVARFLVRATFAKVSDERQKKNVERNRRIGVGFTGYHNWLSKKKIKFSDAPNKQEVVKFFQEMYSIVDKEAKKYCSSLRIPESIKKTTIAPVGTVSQLAGCTTGCQPVFSKFYIRRVRYSDTDDQLKELAEKGYKIEKDMYAANTSVVEFICADPIYENTLNMLKAEYIQEGKTPEEAEALAKEEAIDLIEDQNEVKLEDFLANQRMLQKEYADNAISITINLDPGNTSVDEIKSVLRHYLPDLKGVTLFPEKGMPQSPYERLTYEKFLDLSDQGKNFEVGQAEQDCGPNNMCPIR